MPNWCSNTVEISHEDPAMVERARKGFEEGKLLGEFFPCPQELTDTLAGYPGKDKEEEHNAQMASNIAKYGYKDWYDWQVANWGTKWDVGGDDGCVNELGTQFGHGLILSFDSAWAPPVNAYEKLAELGFSIRAYYYEPGMAFAGIWEDGDDDFYEYGGMNSEQIKEFLPEALDEMFAISEYAAEWEAENEEE